MSKIQKSIEVIIAPNGAYFETDDHGFLINPTGFDKIQLHWKPVINSVVKTYKQYYGSALTHVFIRGSVAKGQAVDNISDIDSFACVSEEVEPINYYESTIMQEYPFCTGVEFQVYTPKDLPIDDSLLIQSVCVYGEPPKQPKLKPGKGMVRNTKGIFPRMKNFQEKLATLRKSNDEEVNKVHCVWLMKYILRTGVELTYERSGRFTRDLWFCYKDFSEYYPDFAQQMHQVLYLALNPTADLDLVEEIRFSMVPFLQDEAVRLSIVKA